MAPSKRASVASSPHKAPHAKKSRTAAPEAPLLSFISSAKELPKPCRDMLCVAVPLCLAVVEGDRHKYQVEILDRVADIVKDTEHKKREALTAVEAELVQAQADKQKAFADAESTKLTGTTKQNECDEKGKVVDGARELVHAAQQTLTTAEQEQEAFNGRKASLLVEQEAFAKLLADSYETLKDGTHSGKKAKEITVLKKKLLEIGAQESLGEALEAALKLKPEKREGAFAKATMQFVDEVFAKHTAKVSQDIAGFEPEAARLASVIANAQQDLGTKKDALQVVSKEWDEMQDVWLQLEKESAEAANTLNRFESKIPDVEENIEAAKADLEKFLEIPALFSKLKEHSTAVHDKDEAEEEQKHEDDAAAAEGEQPDEAM